MMELIVASHNFANVPQNSFNVILDNRVYAQSMLLTKLLGKNSKLK
jgi:hypothetical protein